MLDEPMAVTLQVADLLEQIGVPPAIGDSLARPVYSVMRATAEADLVAALRPEHVAPLAKRYVGALSSGASPRYREVRVAVTGISSLWVGLCRFSLPRGDCLKSRRR
jgi:hypothetical protein